MTETGTADADAAEVGNSEVGTTDVEAPEAGTTEAATPEAGATEAEEQGFRVKLANFEGPFDLLLNLISQHRLDVTEVALHAVTDEFIAYTREMGSELGLE